MMGVKLRITENGSERVEEIHEKESEIVIGRRKEGKKKEGDVVLREKKKAANQYCKIEKYPDGTYWLVALDKKFPTLIEGATVDKARLRLGDIFAIGEAKIQFGEKPPKARARLDLLIRLLPILAILAIAAVLLVSNAIHSGSDAPTPTPPPTPGGNTAQPANPATPGGIGGAAPTPEEIAGAQQRAVREREWWEDVKNPANPDERFEYMDRMLDSMKFYFSIGMHVPLHQLMQKQVQQKRREPVFLCLYGSLIARIPPPKGTPQSRREALDQYLRPAIEADPNFVHGLYLYSVIRLIDHVDGLGPTGTPNRAIIEEVADRLKRATQLRPNFADAHRAAAQAYQYIDMDQSLRHIESALELDSQEEENWQAYLSILHRKGLSDLKEKAEPMLEKHRASNKIRFAVYGLLAQYLSGRNEVRPAWEYMQKALVAAESEPGLLATEQWVQVYLFLGKLAASQAPPNFSEAFKYLDDCVRVARDHHLPMLEIVGTYAEVVNGYNGPDRQARIRRIIDLSFETMRGEALDEGTRNRLIGLVAQMLSVVDLNEYDRSRAWALTLWCFERGEPMLRTSLQLLDKLCPRERNRLDPARVAGVSDAGMDTIVSLLVNAGLPSTEAAIALPATAHLGHLLVATNGKHDARFITAARDIFRQPLTSDQNSRKMNALRVMRIYPVPQLGPTVAEILQKLVEAGDLTECRRVFGEAHPALNLIAEPKFKPDWTPRADTKLDDYREIATGWAERLRQ